VLRLVGCIAVIGGLTGAGSAGPLALLVALVGVVLLAAAARPVTGSLVGIAWRTVAGVPAGIPWAVLGMFRAFGVGWTTVWSVICLLSGLLAIAGSHGASSMFLFTGGVSVAVLGLALVLRSRGAPNRPVFTAFGVFMLLFWLLPFDVLMRVAGSFYGNDPGGFEMFFLSGIMIVLGSTLVLVFNGELLARAVNRLGGALGSLRPSLATAIAYPMASRLRTGMTLAMFSLIIFSITVMSTLNSNFNQLFLSKDATGGWDVALGTNLNNAIPDLKSALAQNGVDTTRIAALGATSGYSGLTDVRMAGAGGWQRYYVRAANNDFLQASTMKLQAHVADAPADAVWKELAARPGTAIIDSGALSGNQGAGTDAPNFQLKGLKSNVKLLSKPVAIEIRNASGQVTPLQVVGIIDQVVQGSAASIFVSEATYRQALAAPSLSYFALRLTPGTDDKVYAKQVKAAMSRYGVQATSIRSDIENGQKLSQGFSYLLQGFMALGLVVGVAAVGVIAARTVVERRQQIGMLRAVGYRRSQIALSFALETSFIALFGIVAGVVTAVILSYNLLHSDTFAVSNVGFTVPVLQIGLFAGIAYVASLVMTLLPSRRAAALPVAEALRYE
jgi:putative ABC transport system permease protein